MKINYWTSNGRKPEDVNEKMYVDTVIAHLRALVRETSYHLSVLEETPGINQQDEAFSRSVYLRQEAVDTLRMFDPEANDFIERTYKPKTFLHA